MKLNTKENFNGGTLIGENFWYDALPGGAYAKGAQFDISEKQVEQQKQFNVKFYYANVTMSKEDIQVLNKGPQAVFRLIDDRMTNAYISLGAFFAISLYLNGVNAGYTNMVNGLAEALNDGTTNSWNQQTYTTYGGITRGGSVGTALNSVPTNVGGAITYNTLEETYSKASFGSIEPTLGVTTPLGYSFVKERFQTQQRFNDTQDPKIGFNGLKFNSATLIKSRYVPGSDIETAGTQSNTVAVEFLKATSGGVVTAYPTPSGSTPSATQPNETLWWINATKPYINLYVTDDPEFGFGFTGFKPAQGNTKVSGQVLAAIALTTEPRYHQQLYDIEG